MIYYFTYDSDDPEMPFQKGWTEVDAPDGPTAIKIFNAVHPLRKGSFINCAAVHPADYFEQTEAFRNGDSGIRCHERITLTIQHFN